MKNALSRFNVRVYGLLINEHNQVLVADEIFKNGTRATKFPGGGLELGEGTKEGLIREFKEETGIDVTVKEHFYTTDFFQASYFDNDSQIISIYYKAESKDWKQISVSNQKFDFTAIPGQEAESFRWVYVRELENEEDITLPIDKVVVAKLLSEIR
jgi:8-oxo-dGTP diphosphatase